MDVNNDVLRMIFEDSYSREKQGDSGDDEWEKYLSFYSQINDDFVDMRDLLKQGIRFLEEIKTRKSSLKATANKRKRTPDADHTT